MHADNKKLLKSVNVVFVEMIAALHKRKRTVQMPRTVGPRQLLECCDRITAGAG